MPLHFSQPPYKRPLLRQKIEQLGKALGSSGNFYFHDIMSVDSIDQIISMALSSRLKMFGSLCLFMTFRFTVPREEAVRVHCATKFNFTPLPT